MRSKLSNLVIALVLFGSTCSAEVQAIAVHMFWRPARVIPDNPSPSVKTEKPFKNLTLRLYITNRGSADIRVPTRGLDETTITERKQLKIIFSAPQPENPLGLKEVLPESTLGIVTLRKNETTAVAFDTFIDEASVDVVTVVYEVPSNFAERYGLWSGKLETKSLTDLEIQSKGTREK